MFNYTVEEKNSALEKYFENEDTLKLMIFPKKQKQKFLCLLWIISLFEKDKTYTEKEVNMMLEPIYPDYVMLRRYLVDFDLLFRTKDGSKYWI